jgi:hypothetical protein
MIETVIEGTLKPDGTLELDQKPNLPPGRVKVVVRQEGEPKPPPSLSADFFQMMEEIWTAQQARGHVSRTVEEVEAERAAMRGQVEDEIQAAIRLQEECRRRRMQAESENSTS